MRIPIDKRINQKKGRLYQVQFGDSLYTISQKFGTSIDNIHKFNVQMNHSNAIFPGEILFIPAPLVKTNKSKKKTRA